MFVKLFLYQHIYYTDPTYHHGHKLGRFIKSSTAKLLLLRDRLHKVLGHLYHQIYYYSIHIGHLMF